MPAWRIPGDTTPPVITAAAHVRSAHGASTRIALPPTCVLFEMGAALRVMEQSLRTVTLCEALPCFLDNPKVIAVHGHDDVCFTRGGFGAPAAVDTLETLRVLGVERVLIVGMCGGFAPTLRPGDVIVPERILSEEGVSSHYLESVAFALPDDALFRRTAAHFSHAHRVTTAPTVTSDGFYRQTFAKEAAWRACGCVGVDMEASALLTVSRYYDMPAAAALICSDRHPLSPDDPPWNWGSADFRALRNRFILDAVDLGLQLAKENNPRSAETT